jgi:PHD/YefM family antitoxin component YafN of YafNO toxin-antitoxin module
MPAKHKSVKEARATYRPKRKRTAKSPATKVTLRWAEIEGTTQPIVLEKDGQPVAVVLKYAEYQRLGAAQTEHRQKAWHGLDALLAQVHARTAGFSAEEIEADITAARQEVREQHNAHRRG